MALAAGITQPYYSRIERGREVGASLLVLAACAAALNVQLAAFVEAMPGASLPRDIEHLRHQSLLVAIARRSGWRAAPEAALANDGPRPRSIDVLLTRTFRREAAVVEIWDLLLDGGDAMRSIDAKVAATAARLAPDWRVRGLLLLRRTSRNKALVRDLAPLLGARFPAASAAWLKALANETAPMPDAWPSVSGDRLFPTRLAGAQ